MIARRDASPPRSGAAGSDRLRLLVATAAAAAPARRRFAARALPEQPQRGRHAPPVLPVLRGEPVALLTFRAVASPAVTPATRPGRKPGTGYMGGAARDIP